MIPFFNWHICCLSENIVFIRFFFIILNNYFEYLLTISFSIFIAMPKFAVLFVAPAAHASRIAVQEHNDVVPVGWAAKLESFQCKDDENFVDAAGYKCSAWSTAEQKAVGAAMGPCDTVQKRMTGQYTVEALEQVQIKCPKSCQSCSTVANFVTTAVKGCEDATGWVDEKSKTCTSWEGWSCDKAASLFKYSIAGQDALLKNCRKSCNICTDADLKALQKSSEPVKIEAYAGAGDNPTFKDAKGYGCATWKITGCDKVSPGYTITDMKTIKANCKTSCP